MALLIRCLTLLLLIALASQSRADSDGRFISLSYHEVLGDHEPLTPTAIRASDLAQQFAWLKANNYHPVSVDQILTARSGGKPLPPNAILLSFDDGKRDVYTRAFPLLKLFNYPAVIALVGKWLEVPPGQTVDYDGKPLPRSEFVTWSEVKEMQASGLIEAASHSYDLHRGIPSNPQGNTQPAATTRQYINGQYEDDAAYRARIQAGLKNIIALRTGKATRIIVWPYGRSNLATQEIAAQLGMPIGLSLEDGYNTASTPTAAWKRQLIENSPSLQSFAEMLRANWNPDPTRSVRIDPAEWKDPEAGLSQNLERLLSLAPNIAFIKPSIAVDDRESALFLTTRRPLADDRLNHIAWQTERRAGVPVFIDLPATWLNEPELIGDLARQVNFAGLRIQATPDNPAVQKIRAAAGRWRQPLQIAFAMDTTPPVETWSQLTSGDLIILPARTEIIDALPAAAKTRVLLEFDSTLPAPQIADQMRRLEASGFRSFGISAFPETGMETIFPAFSLRAQPQLR
jgi:biofilm PGA synthesis lipoprotein PgaB